MRTIQGVQRPQRLSGLDASFLYLETPNQPLQVFTVLELDASTIPGGYSYDRFCADLATRIRAIPAFREELSEPRLDVGFPAWVEDRDFDIHRHVHRIGLRAPGGQAEVAEVCGLLAGLPLDRRGPLWEMWVIEGPEGSDRLTVLLKMHHAAADGVTYAEFLSDLCSAEVEAPPPLPVRAAQAASPVRMSLSGLVQFLMRPVLLFGSVLPGTISAVADIVRRTRAGRAMAAPFSAPRTRLNAPFAGRRNVAFASLALDDIKKVKNHYGVTVNDVVMALAAGVVRRFLLDRGELPKASLVAMVPSSVHEASDRPARNQVSGMFTRLQTQVTDPAERVKAIAVANTIAKEQSSEIGATLLQDWFEIFGSVALGVAKRVYGRLTRVRPMYNVIVSNVPGPRVGNYFLGAKVIASYPFGPILLGAGLNITVWTVNGTMHFGLISAPEVVPDLDVLAAGLSVGLAELLAEIG